MPGTDVTFSQQVKQELCAAPPIRPCCAFSACYGFACFAKYFDVKGLVIHTEKLYIAKYIHELFKSVNLNGKIYVRSNGSYEYAIKDPLEADKMLAFFGATGKEASIRIERSYFDCESCFASFCTAVFLIAGTVTNPEKEYALEFSTGRYNLSRDFSELLQQHDFMPKTALRKGVQVIYFKASEQIEDMLTYMGATKCAMEVMNLKAYKDVRNTVNRITNCETANIEKSVSAAERYLKSIEYLEKHKKLTTLPEELLQIAVLRRQNPEISLAELGRLCEPPLGKSGVSHRLKRIELAAQKLREGN